jgi:putative ABC transport system permease protein
MAKNRLYASINLMGLVSGIAASLLILGYINFETNYDHQYTNADRIYRIKYTKTDHNVQVISSVKTPSRLAQVAPLEIPGIQSACRIYPEPCLIRYKDEKMANQEVLWVDETFFQVFEGILIAGDPTTVLDGPDKMVITQRMATALFGNDDPIGQQLKVNEGMPFEVTGVVKDPITGTHLKYDFLNSMSTFVKYGWMQENGDWNGNWVYTYIATAPGTPPTQIQNGLNQLSERNFGFLREKGQDASMALQPIKAIHLNSHESDELQANGDIQYVYVMGAIAIAIMLMVWINFVNLSTALSLGKARSTGIRKAFGASRGQLVVQYLSESVFINFLAMSMAILLVCLCQAFFEQIMGVHLDFSMLGNLTFWLLMFGIFVLGVVLSAFYPAMVISSFRPIEALKNRVSSHSGSALVRQSLITIQFTAAIFLTVGTLVVYQQVNFMREHDLGANMDQMMVLRGPTSLNGAWDDQTSMQRKITRYDHFKKELLQYSFVEHVTSVFHIPGEDIRQKVDEVDREDTGETKRAVFNVSSIDESFFPCYQVELLEGTNFRRDLHEEHAHVILNEQAVRALGYISASEALGKTIRFHGSKWQIIGVARDFHQKALSEAIKPILFINKHPHEFGYYVVRVHSEDIQTTVSQVKAHWLKSYPEDPFHMFFADDYFNRQYQKDEQFGKLFTFFAILSILIANLGLVALTSFAMAQRMKEIGIRKVLGANLRHVVLLFFRRFITPIVLAALLAFPLLWFVLSDWLANYAYHISINPFWMLLCALMIFLISLLNIGYYVSRLSTTNPAEILRDE